MDRALMVSLLAAYNEHHLLFLGSWGPKWLFIFALLATLVLVLTWFDLQNLHKKKRWILLALRAIILGLGIIFVAEPALEMRDVERVPNHIAVLVDDSASMQLPATKSKSRHDVLQTEIAQFEGIKNDQHLFDFYRFGHELQSASLREIQNSSPKQNQTDLQGALKAVHARYPAAKLGGVIILSDGSDNASLAGKTRDSQTLDESTKEQLDNLGVPVHTVQVAQQHVVKDIAIRRIHHDDFAFVRNAVKIDVDIEVHGYKKGSYPVRLRRNGTVLSTQQLNIESGKIAYNLAFEFVPETLGKEIYSLDIPVEQDDAVPENNQDFFVLNIIRDKIRVLQVVGRPTWDVRFLRKLLRDDPNVDLISFFILRGFDNVYRAPESEMSLIPFPTQELFEEQLGSFDLVILQDFEFGPFGIGQYLPNIRQYVKRGGGLLMIGGQGSFSTGGYARTPIEDVLPVTLKPFTNMAATIDYRDVRPQLTDAGKRHPITRLEFDPQENQQLWSRLPKMQGTNVVGEAKPGAIVLAEHPNVRAGRSLMPIIAIQDQDKGRSMALTVDSLWRWAYDQVLDGGSSRAYSSFWNSAIRWLIRDPALSLIQLNIGQSVVQKGSKVQIDIRAFNADYSPATNAPIELQLTRRSLMDLVTGADSETLQESTSIQTDDRGRARWIVEAEEDAAWRVKASMKVTDGLTAEAEEVFLSTHHSTEMRDVEPRDDLLELIAEATDGVFSRAGEKNLTKLPFTAPKIERVNKRKSVGMWSTPWILLLFVALLGVEWQLRRLWGRL